MQRLLVTTGLGLALLALTVAAAPVHAAPSANTRCISEAAQAGLLGPDRNPTNTNFVGGTDGDDRFIGATTAGPDVICGFGGNDAIGFGTTDVLNADDVFLGGAGSDFVGNLNGGTFNGGAGNDTVSNLNGGTFNGGEGNDGVIFLRGGTFNGEAGNDGVTVSYGGTFNGGAGSDFVGNLNGGTFNQD